MGYSPWGHKELVTTEQLTHTEVHTSLRRFPNTEEACLFQLKSARDRGLTIPSQGAPSIPKSELPREGLLGDLCRAGGKKVALRGEQERLITNGFLGKLD